MNIVIMAAGEGSRMRPITRTTPKPLIKICGKTLIEHNIEPIIDEVDEVYMIVKYKASLFEEYFGESYHGKKIHYIYQGDENGTGAAILALEGKIQGEFVVLSGDDLYDAEDIRALMHTSGYATLCKSVENPSDFGIFVRDADGNVTSLIEKPTDKELGNLASIGNHKFDEHIFDMLASLPLSPRGEREITDLITHYISLGEYNVVEAHGRWITIGYPWDILKADDAIIGGYTSSENLGGTVEDGVTLRGNIYIEKGALIKTGTYIEGNAYIGKNAILGPNAYIRGNAHIGDGSKVGAFVEYKNSYMGEYSSIPHLSYIGDSVICNQSNLGGGTKTANLRHDKKNIRVMVKEKLVDTGRRKLGAIIGDGVHTGINTLIYPGRVIDTDSSTLPGEVIR